MTAFGMIATFIGAFSFTVGTFAYMDGKKEITIPHIFMGIGFGTFMTGCVYLCSQIK